MGIMRRTRDIYDTWIAWQTPKIINRFFALGLPFWHKTIEEKSNVIPGLPEVVAVVFCTYTVIFRKREK